MHSGKLIDSILQMLPTDMADLTPETFASWIEKTHGYEVGFLGVPLPPGLFGCCLIVDDPGEPPGAVVVCDSTLTPTHQTHIRFHELAHLALGHRTWVGPTKELELALVDPTRVAALVGAFSCRASKADLDALRVSEDEEAELLTRLLVERVFAARQKHFLRPGSSRQDLDEALRHMGMADDTAD